MQEKTQNILIVAISVAILITIIGFALNLITTNNGSIRQNPVAEIIDGDTFKLESGDVVRLLCVNTPEEGEPGYEEATSFLESRIFNKNITLEGSQTDKYSRLLRWVLVNGSLINKEIIDNNLGEVFELSGEDCWRVRNP